METYRTLNPTTEELLEEYPLATDAAVERALDAAVEAFAGWSRRGFDDRAAALGRAADLLEAQADDLARLMAREMGKRVAEGRAEAEKCAWACRHYAGRAAGYLADSPRESDGSRALVRHDPLGPVLAIMPWNFPFWQLFRFAAPGLMAGNVCLLKHAPNTPGCALRIVALLEEAGLPRGVVQNLFLSNEQAARVIADRRVRGVTLTGSTRAGRAVGEAAGRALKPTVLELGGSDAFIVLDDADVAAAAETGVASRCLNNGQSCIAAKRFLVHARVHDAFVDAFVDGMRAKVPGDPADGSTTLGPLARADLRDTLADQVERSVAAGARRLLGGDGVPERGFFYPATVLADPPDGSPAADEELFGPAATVIRVADEDEAVAVANRTAYGLGCSLWTSDPERAARCIPRIEAGAVFVNGLVKSDPRLPFGGVKDSGHGRELSAEGILEFVNRKTVWIA